MLTISISLVSISRPGDRRVLQSSLIIGEDHEEDINVDDLQLNLQPPERPRTSGGGNASTAEDGGGGNDLSRPNLTSGTHSLHSVIERSAECHASAPDPA